MSAMEIPWTIQNDLSVLLRIVRSDQFFASFIAMKIIVPLPVVVLLFFILGCDGNSARVSGQVRFADGKFLDSGSIVMLREGKPALRIHGGIASDGRFKVGLYREGDKCPTGIYKVYLLSTDSYQLTTQTVSEGGRSYQNETRTYVRRVAPQYHSASTTPITVDIQRGKNNLDIVVEEP